MRSFSVLALAAAVIGSSMGCGGTDTPPPAAKAASASDLVIASPGVPEDPIARVVYEFLDAMRQGDSAGVSRRLTPLALQRTKETDSPILPPGSPTARFKVGNVEMIDAEKAVVDSVWTDLDADGKPSDEPILWALKQSEGQWRVSGMVAEQGLNQPVVIIDFENPESLAHQQPPRSSSATVLGGNPPGGQVGGEVARNPFDQASQR